MAFSSGPECVHAATLAGDRMIALRDRSACTDGRRTPVRVTSVQHHNATDFVGGAVVLFLFAGLGFAIGLLGLLVGF